MTSSTTIADVASKISGVTNRDTWTNTPTTKGKVTIPKGYHSGSGYVDTSKVYSAGVTAGTAIGGYGYILLEVYFFSGQANVSSGLFHYTFKLTNTSLTGIKFTGSFARSIYAKSNCTISESSGYYYVTVTDKSKEFKLGSDLATAQTAQMNNIYAY